MIGPTAVFINTGSNDTQTPKHHGEQIRDAIQANCQDCPVTYKEWAMGHVMKIDEGLKQLMFEY